MKLNVENVALDIPCPRCGQEIHETIGRLKNDPNLTCTACGQPFLMDLNEFNTKIAAVEKSLDDFGSAFRK